jgi:hypothetical protein
MDRPALEAPVSNVSGARRLLRFVFYTLLWPVFRFPPVKPWLRHLTSGALVLAALAPAAPSAEAQAKWPRALVGADQHGQISLSQALALTFCHRYGAVGPSIFPEGPPSQTYEETITARFGSIDRFCQSLHYYANNENGLFLLETLLLSLPPNDSPASLSTKLAGARLAVVGATLYVLALFGTGILPLIAIAFVAAQVIEMLSVTHANTIYPMMTVLPLAGAVVAAAVTGMQFRRALAVQVALGLLAGCAVAFIYNWRTSYGLVVLGQILSAMLLHWLFERAGSLRRWAGAAASLIAGFALFQAVLIWPLSKHTGLTYHVVWHPIVLSLAQPPNSFAEQQGIVWDDQVGPKLAQRVDPNATYLSPTYESSLRTFYFDLWRRHPWEMLNLYRDKFALVGASMLRTAPSELQWPEITKLASEAIPNGFVWFGALAALTLLAAVGYRRRPFLSRFFVAIGAGTILISLEQALIYPRYFIYYHGAILVAFVALLSMAPVLLTARQRSFRAAQS